MKTILLLAGLCALAAAVPTSTKWIPKKYKIDDKEFLEKQMNTLRLYKYMTQPLYEKDLVDIAHTFNPEVHLDLYTHPEYVKEFMFYYHHTILPKGHLFSIFDPHHLKQAVALFKTLYYAKDYDTFFKTAVWARENVNEYMWVYCYSVALVHRTDTYGIVLPPIYEIFPYYFFDSDVIYKAQYYKQVHHTEYPKSDDYNGYTIFDNLTGTHSNIHPEGSLSYFFEDSGIVSGYYYWHLFYPFWMESHEFNLDKDHRGQIFYAYHQSLLARYTCERVSFHLPPIPRLTADMTVDPGFYPKLEYPNGIHFPSRPENIHLYTVDVHDKAYYNFTYSYTNVLDYARRMRDALSLGYVYTHSGQKVSLFDKDGLELFANLLEGTPNSPDIEYYGILQMYVRHILGHAPTPLDKDHVIPSAVEHYETALRDPAYWYFIKWIVYYIQEYKLREPHHYYTVKDLQFPGVKIESMQVDRLVTYFDYWYADLSHAVYYDHKHETEPLHVRVRQQRLNHKPFTYTINVQSDHAVDAVVRVYIGPKYDSYERVVDINDNRLNFYLIDKFVQHLSAGKTPIVRNSKQTLTVSDKTTYWQLYKRVMGAIKGNDEFVVDGSETYWGMPNRYLLPIGTHGGLEYQFYVIITPYVKGESVVQKIPEETYYPRVGSGFFFYDNHGVGFPFDKPVQYNKMWKEVENAFFYDVSIYHKGTEESLNVST